MTPMISSAGAREKAMSNECFCLGPNIAINAQAISRTHEQDFGLSEDANQY
jgi:hypothetical protein